jgi:hypothetical protein
MYTYIIVWRNNLVNFESFAAELGALRVCRASRRKSFRAIARPISILLGGGAALSPDSVRYLKSPLVTSAGKRVPCGKYLAIISGFSKKLSCRVSSPSGILATR